MFSSSKKRLYIALYPGDPNDLTPDGRYQWAFLLGNKDETPGNRSGTRCTVRHHPNGRWYEEVVIGDLRFEPLMYARIRIAKVRDKKEALKIIRETPRIHHNPRWNSCRWAREVLRRLGEADGCFGRSRLDWRLLETKARVMVEAKIGVGRLHPLAQVQGPAPTWDMILNQETQG